MFFVIILPREEGLKLDYKGDAACYVSFSVVWFSGKTLDSEIKVSGVQVDRRGSE